MSGYTNIYKKGRICAVLAAMSCFAWTGLSQEVPSVNPTVMVEKARMGLNSIDKKYIGQVEAIETIAVQARVSGNLMSSHFKEGGRVDQGQLLFEIEDTQYKAAVENAKAQIQRLDAQLSYSKSSYERYARLVKNGSVSQDTVDNAKSQYDTLKAEKAAAEAQLTIAEDNLNHTKVMSPISGKVGRVRYSNGNYVTPQSEPLLTITYMDDVYVRFPMSQRDFLSLFGTPKEMKQDAVISLILSDGKPYDQKGQVEMMDNQVRSTTDSLNVWTRFGNSDGKLVPGGIVTVHLSKKQVREMPSVPVSAIIHREMKSYVYVLDKDNKVHEKQVMLDKMDGTRQFLRSGIKQGEVVVIDGMHKTRPGGVVEPVYTKE